MSEHMFFQGNPSGKADDAPSELSTLSVLCELLGKVDALERRVDGNAEQIRKDWNAHFRQYGYMEERLIEVEQRIDALERRLNRKSIETSGESLKIADESIKIGGGE